LPTGTVPTMIGHERDQGGDDLFASCKRWLSGQRRPIGEQTIAALEAAFPATTIDRAMIEAPTSLWDDYDDHAELTELEGKTWRDVDREWLWKHPDLLIGSGDELWRALVPAYLVLLLGEPDHVSSLPWHVAGTLERKPDRATKFDRRIAPLSATQRAAIRQALERLATMSPFEAPMVRALETWKSI
jgi:hypothetical protein